MAAAEHFLGSAGFDRAPWLAVAFGSGIVAWFVLPGPRHWIALLLGCCGASAAAAAALRRDGAYPYLRLAGVVIPLVVACGCASVWTRSSMVGAEPIARPTVATLIGKVMGVEVQPAQSRRRLILAVRDPAVGPPGGRAIRVRLNLPDETPDHGPLQSGAIVKVRARLVPPAPPMLPGAYNFARTAWFSGLSATGTALSAPEVLRPGQGGASIDDLQLRLSEHVRQRLAPDSSGIAAALATGDTGGIAEADAQAMRDSGLAHLLSISGLHVSAVIGAVYILALRLLALWPWLALRVRLPVLAAGCGALAGLAYTLLTGSQVPTVRSCIGALLVLTALALGREALSLRMLALAAFLVMLLWPEAVMGPSFQMSFAAVLAIVALSGARPVRAFLAPREEGLAMRALRHLVMVLVTGIVIELALMPIALYHFHRGGIYGALANVVAIPLTTIVIMPSVLSALILDVVGAGKPLWWIAGHAIGALTGVAHWVASRPGAVTVLPAFGGGAYALFVAGGLWLGLWSGRVRWFGMVPALVGVLLLIAVRPADILVSGDGRHVGIMAADGKVLFTLRQSRSSFAKDNLNEIAGISGEPVLLARWPGARCNDDACMIAVRRGGRDWRLLLTRSRGALPERSLAAACERVDLVISDRWLPRSCRPRWLKADRKLLQRTGGLAIDLKDISLTTVAEDEGRHGWWKAPDPNDYPRSKQLRSPTTATASAGARSDASTQQTAEQFRPTVVDQ